MMPKSTADMIWDHVRQMHGIAVRLIDQFPAEQFDAHPIPNMRTPKQLVVHMYRTSVQAVAEGIVTGEIAATDPAEEKTICERVKTKTELAAVVNDCWKKASQAVARATDAQLNGMVKTPWGGMTLPGFVCVNIVRDELTHHRGQLYAFARALGHDVPMMWDFEHNAPEFQPKPQPAKA
jgi:uncharacterized damage-inducible protein DinB